MANQPQVTNQDRKQLEVALAAALLLIYKGHARAALDRLGLFWQDVAVSAAAQQRLNAFAAERAALVQSGINQRLDGAAAQDDPGQARQQAQSEIQTYNDTTLSAFLVSRASHEALIDTMRSAPDPNGSGTSAAAATPWQWTRYTDNPPDDECQDAADISPASLDDILAASGGPPPRHPRCACDLSPA